MPKAACVSFLSAALAVRDRDPLVPVAERPGCRKGKEEAPKTLFELSPLCDDGAAPSGEAKSEASGWITTAGEAVFSGLICGTGGASG